MSKIKKIFQISDLHIRLQKRHDEFEKQFEKLFDKMREEKPDRLVITGDLVHSKVNCSPELFSMLSKLLSVASTLVEYVIIIPGNHDTILESERLDAITPVIDALNNPKLIYIKDSGCFVDPGDDSVVWTHWSIFENYKSPEIKKYRENNDPNNEKSYIGLFHGVLQGSYNALNYDFEGEGFEIDNFVDADIVMAGDIHKYQYWRGGEIVMASSFIQNDFGESVDHHGAVIWDRVNEKKWAHTYFDIPNDNGFFTIELNGYENLGEEDFLST